MKHEAGDLVEHRLDNGGIMLAKTREGAGGIGKIEIGTGDLRIDAQAADLVGRLLFETRKLTDRIEDDLVAVFENLIDLVFAVGTE